MATVRTASSADAEALAALNAEFNGVARTPGAIRESLTSAASLETVLVAQDDEVVVGFLALQTLRSVCYAEPWVEVTELYVAPPHRNRGVGRALLDNARDRARLAGASELFVRVNVKNDPMQRLLERIGIMRTPQLVFTISLAPA
jgi:ribosomal protein S18 acetylase RimI-like enzyme